MEALEKPVLEPRADRITRYKAERKREPAQRHGNAEELPNKWVRREEDEVPDPQSRAQAGTVSADGEGVNGRKGGVTNGEVEPPDRGNRSGR